MAEEDQEDIEETTDEDEEELDSEEEGSEEEEGVKKKGDAEALQAEGGGSQKLVSLMLVLNIVVLGVIATLVWMNLSKSRERVSLADVEASKTAQAGEEASEEEFKEPKFVKEAFTVNLADSSGSHFAKVDVEIEVADDFVREELIRLRPRIRDFIVVVLSSKTYEQIASIDGRDFLREEIRNKINGYLTKGQVQNVYFTQFIIQ